MIRKQWQSVAVIVLALWSVGLALGLLTLTNEHRAAVEELSAVRSELDRLHYNQRSIGNFAFGLGVIHAIRQDYTRPLPFMHRAGERELWDDPDKWTPDLFPFMMDNHGNPQTLEPDGTIRTHYGRGEQ